MLVSAFLGVFVRVHPSIRAFAFLAAVVAAFAMMIGDWHFLSDLIAGGFLGSSIGILAGELWVQHTKKPSLNRAAVER